MSVDRLDTPALLLDLDKAVRNLDRMAAAFAGSRVKLRPHAKTHKTPLIARMQLERGAIGICCAKLGEAEAMAQGGIEDLLITTEIVGEPKIERLIALARRARVTIVVDDADAAAAIDRAAARAGLRLRTLVDVDVGQHRTGVEPGVAAVRLGSAVDRMQALDLAGIQGYEGHLQHVVDVLRATGRKRCRDGDARRDRASVSRRRPFGRDRLHRRHGHRRIRRRATTMRSLPTCSRARTS